MSIIARNQIIELKRLFHITADLPGMKGNQSLAISIGENHFCFAIANPANKRLFQITYYSVIDLDESFLKDIFAEHPELSDPYNKVFISFAYPQSSLVPLQYYKEENSAQLLHTLFGVNGKSAILSDAINEWQLYNVYSTPKKVLEWVNEKFPSHGSWHQYTVGIKNINNIDEKGKLWVDFREDDFTVIAAKNNKFLLAQTFSYSTPDDVNYYLLKICRQFSLSQQEVVIALSGLIEKQSALYKEIYQYFMNVEFKNADWSLNGNNNHPAHFFSLLNDLVKCGS